MESLWWVIGIAAVIAMVAVYACCKISGDISQYEERQSREAENDAEQ